MAVPRPLIRTDDPDFAELLARRPHLRLEAMVGLMIEEVPLARIAAAIGTPAWVYSAAALRRRVRCLAHALAAADLTASLHFAVKCNANRAILSLLAASGMGADVVSGGELRIAREAGIPPARIVFSGVGKTAEDIALALEEDILQINAESAEEIALIAAIAARLGREARVALRLNPDVDAGTHAKITTGRRDNKFGVTFGDAVALYAQMAALPGIRPVGLAVHIGSQITGGTEAFRTAYAQLGALAAHLRARGLPIERLDCGGGLGISYRDEIAPSAAALAGVIRATLGPLGVPVMLEPGRWIAGPAGILLTAVIAEKCHAEQRFVVVDAGMNDLLRPALYEAWHGIVPVSAVRAVAPLTAADVVGPVCESSDTFARARPLPRLHPGDLLAILDAGAYGAVMSSTYNARPLAPEVLVDGNRFAVVRRRQSFADMRNGQQLPAWVAP